MNTTQDKLDSVLRKIQALLANAEDPGNTPAAQESYRAKAEALMFQYRVEENQLAQSGTVEADSIRPVWRMIFTSRPSNEFAHTYLHLAAQAVQHAGGEFVAHGTANADDEGRYWWGILAVGYESDLRYAELLFTSMQLGFATKMEPKVDPNKTDAENAYALRSAGLEGHRIAKLLWNDDSKANRVKARKLFVQHATALGESTAGLTGRGSNVKTFRASYIDGFEREMRTRLRRMRFSTGDDGRIVLASREGAIKEALYEKYPNMRPSTTVATSRQACEKCAKAKSGYCREHNYLRPRMGRETSFSAAGYSRGQFAARSVELGSTGRGRVTGNEARALNN